MPAVLAGNLLKGDSNFTPTPPPAWWLREMALFDPELRIFPSAQAPTFILARVARVSGGEPLHSEPIDTLTGKKTPQNPDTVYMHFRGLVRVCEILPGVIWDMRVFQRLANHDIRRLGGAAEVANRLDAMDEAKRASIQRDIDDEGAARSRDAYKGYKTRIGERLSLAKSQGRGDIHKTPVSVLVSKPTPGGLTTASPTPVKG